MSEDTQKVTETTTQVGDTVQRTTAVNDSKVNADHQQNVAERVIWYLAGIVLVLLGFRFVLALLGANASNGFVNFIYSTSHPLVSPFFSLFNYHSYMNGKSQFEIYTLAAIVIYTVVAWGIARLLTLNRD